MVTSGVVIAIPGIAPQGNNGNNDTSLPEPDAASTEGQQFCSTGPAQSGTYVTEYEIPSECTQPVAITADDQGNIWFAETATGRVAKFDPTTLGFVEYTNPFWPSNTSSMMWGMDYVNGSVWYTEDAYDSVWKFSTISQEYTRVPFPKTTEITMPQALSVLGKDIVVNDFRGGAIVYIDSNIGGSEEIERILPSPRSNSWTGGFDVDSENNLWYTNWIYQESGVLVKFDQSNANFTTLADDATEYLTLYQLPPGLSTPNGLTVDADNTIWIADTSSSFFFSFDPDIEVFTRYPTSEPPVSTYGNASGLIYTPLTRPYWTALDDHGRLVFNEQTGNRIAIFDPKDESLVEYLIPSKNPHWSDCTGIEDCGLAQVLGFTVAENKIWFTEWAENKIGVVDTSVELPFTVDVPLEASIRSGESVDVIMQIMPTAGYDGDIQAAFGTPDPASVSLSHKGIGSPGAPFVSLSDGEIGAVGQNETIFVTVSISVNESVPSGHYKVLLGAQNDEVAVSKYVTIRVPLQIP